MDANRKQRADVHGPVMASALAESRPRGGRAEPSRHLHRPRDFGVGYGNSSGYAVEEHFTDGHADPLFRLG